jgi:uncharacterized membrane protein YecN with MAPEG domain
MSLPITSTVAALLAVIMVPLTLQVSMRRAGLGKAMGDLTGVVFGDGDDDTLRRRTRAFGNFIEYVPTCLVLLALIEIQGAGATVVWTAGGLLVVGRVLHALGMLFADSPAPRGLAMFMTYGALLTPAGWLLMNVVL